MAEEDRDLERQKAQKNAVKAARRAEREVKRRKLRKTRTEEEEIAERIAAEERMLVLAQRKLESIRMLDELLERVKVNDCDTAFRLLHTSTTTTSTTALAG
jgi:arginine/serine-rich splicing factor 17